MVSWKICCNKGREGHKRVNDRIKQEGERRGQGKLHNEMALGLSFKNQKKQHGQRHGSVKLLDT